MVDLDIRVLHTFRRQRWRKVAHRNVGIAGKRRIHRDFVSVVPVATWDGVALEEVDVETCLGEFAVRNKATDIRVVLNEISKDISGKRVSEDIPNSCTYDGDFADGTREFISFGGSISGRRGQRNLVGIFLRKRGHRCCDE